MLMYNILIIDDDEDDQLLLKLAFEENGATTFNLEFASDGMYALERLTNQPSLPDLILLDLNMPRINGFEVLDQLKRSQEYCRIPVIVLSTSAHKTDIDRAYQLGANSFIIKADNQLKLESMIESIRQYWFAISELPSK